MSSACSQAVSLSYRIRGSRRRGCSSLYFNKLSRRLSGQARLRIAGGGDQREAGMDFHGGSAMCFGQMALSTLLRVRVCVLLTGNVWV